jgi:F0F1-type ATP synthase delta subunit
LILGLFLGVVRAFVRAFFQHATDESDEEVQAKVEELKQAFVPKRLRRGLQRSRRGE